MYLFKLLIFMAFFYCVQCKNNLKTLTESMGQEVIEIGAPKDLPEGLEEEPSAEEFSDEEQTTTTVQAATKKDTKRITTKPPPVQTTNTNQLSQEEDEARIEKELAEIYKDTDYKSEPSEVVEEVSEVSEIATSLPSETTEKEPLRQRNRVNFKFQPDMTNKADIEKFKTSIDEINCDLRVTQRLSANNFEPVAIDRKCYGNFFNGDAYIVLKSTGDSNSSLSYDVHFWLGSKSSQDKRGAAAIWTVTLDDMLNGKAVHHREPQGHESAAFLGYFKPAIRYVEGGNESGFTEVETNAGAEKRLLKLSGSETMRIEEVPAESSSLTSDHCFILEVDHDIFVLMPEGAKATQRRKIISVANSLRDDYHNGRATIEIIDEFSSDDDYALFFEALGSGSKDDLQSDDSTNSYAREDMSAVYLYRVLTGDDIDVVAISKPYKQKHLSSEEVYILDTPDTGVYIWLGSGVDGDIKKNYLDIATKYLEIKSYPAWVSITRLSEDSESSTFKQYFHDWDTTSGSIRAFASELDAGYGTDEDDSTIAKHIGKSATARGLMPDDGDGSLVVIRFPGEEDVTDTVTSSSILYNSEVYIVKYQYTNSDGNDAWVVYAWIGKNASKDDIADATKFVNEIEDEIESNLTIVRIPQGQECKHFLKIFKGNLAILYGCKDNDYKPENSNGNYEDNKTRLFRVEGTTTDVDMRAVQVPEVASILEDDDVFILETDGAVYVWNGKESNAKEQAAALGFVKVLLDDREAEVVEQGSEPDDFWDALGGAADEKEDPSGWKLTVNRRVNTPTTLTAVTVKVTGKVAFEDLDTQYGQQDLSEDGVYILDSGEELYLWQGKNIPERAKTSRELIVERYIEDDGMDRTADTALIVVVKQGSEPSAFKKHFKNWEDDLWVNQTSYEDLKNETKAANSK